METFSLYGLGLGLSWAAAFWIRSLPFRQLILLLVSYALYVTWGKWFLLSLLVSSLVNYGLGQYLRRRTSGGRLWLGIGFNLIFLGVFKYLPGLVSSAPSHSMLAGFQHIVMPLGVSFWTFQAISFHFEIYRGEEIDPSLLEFCLYMAFWPTVISGPICRLSGLLPQLRRVEPPSWGDLSAGAPRIGTGLLMLGLARFLAAGLGPGQGVDAGFARMTGRWSGIDVWFLAVGYGFNLFFDFAGYSSLVIGAARLCGFELPENFARPYLSTTPSAFWTRWHMSLSFWIRDFVFVPLASVHRSLWWRNFALFLSMVLFGLWHKGTLLFLIWGALQGTLLVLHRQWLKLHKDFRLNIPGVVLTPLGWLITFAGISVGWIFFRSANLDQAWTMVKALVTPAGYLQRHLPVQFYLLTAGAALGYFAVVAATDLLSKIEQNTSSPPALQALLRERWIWLAPGIAAAAVYGYVITEIQQTSLSSPFLYRLF
jgi:alginate O-acetyltransferase complex protein AlgI